MICVMTSGRNILSARLRMRPFNYVDFGPIMLKDNEVHGREVPERVTEVTATDTALRKTSGITTADPRLMYTPPSFNPVTMVVTAKVAMCGRAAIAAPSAAGCVCGVSVPKAT